MRQVFDGFDVTLSDAADGARPGLHLPAAKAFIEALGVPVNPKEGWTDVARFSALGIPAVNFGPGRPQPRPHGRRALPRRAVRRRRGRPAALAGLTRRIGSAL